MDKFQQLKKGKNRYYLVKWTSDSCTLESSHRIGRYNIKAGELVYDAVYLNPFANFKKWYTPFGEGMNKKNCQVEYFYFKKGKGTINKSCHLYCYIIKYFDG